MTGHSLGRAAWGRRALALTIKQAAALLVSLLVGSAVIFVAIAALPGDQASIRAGVDATTEQVELLRQEMGLDRPLVTQYLDWLSGVAHGDLGVSLLDNRSVTAELAEKLAVTAPLCAMALVASVIVGIPLGVIAAYGSERAYGQMLGAVTQLGMAVPTFVTGMVIIRLLAVRWDILPAQGFPPDRWAQPGEALRSLVLPALTLMIPLAAGLMRFARSATLEVLEQEWMRAARAGGWSRGAALVRQGVRNASLPLVSVIGLEFAALIMGSVIVEQLFALPGVGTMILADVGNRDLNAVQGELLVLTALIMSVTLLLDLIYKLIDPRLGVSR